MTVTNPHPAPDPEHCSSPPDARRSVWTELRDAIRGTGADYTKIPLRRAVFLLAVPMVLELVLESTFRRTVHAVAVHAGEVEGGEGVRCGQAPTSPCAGHAGAPPSATSCPLEVSNQSSQGECGQPRRRPSRLRRGRWSIPLLSSPGSIVLEL